MSPDRTTITRAEAIRRRKEDEQQQREQNVSGNISGRKTTSAPKAAATTPRAKRVTPQSVKPAAPSGLRRRFDITMSTPHSRSSAYSPPQRARKTLTLPDLPRIHLEFGPRWFSFIIIIFCLADLYVMLNIDPFIVRRATIQGIERLNVQEVENALGAQNQPAAVLNPAQIEYNLLSTFPEIASAQVYIDLPARLVVKINERKPVAAWTQDGQTVWVDKDGFAFAPRGDAPNLVTILANGAAPAPVENETANKIGAHPFLATDLANEISTLSTSLPEGASLVFDPKYGLGWSDPGGWKVYFGQSSGDAPLKLQVYQAILKYLGEQDLKPTLISVEYPNAPFYRTEPLEQ